MNPAPLECAEARRLLNDRLDGAVDLGTERRLLLHLQSCGPCGAEDSDLRRLDRALGAVAVPAPPPGFTDAVIAALDRAPSGREPSPFPGRVRRVAVHVAGATVVGLLGAGLAAEWVASGTAAATASLLPAPVRGDVLGGRLLPPWLGPAVAAVRSAVPPALAAALAAVTAGALAAQAAAERRRRGPA